MLGRRHGTLVLVAGEAGVGKTELLSRFCGLLPPGVRVLWGACEPLSTPRPLAPVVEIAGATGGDLSEAIAHGEQPYEVASALSCELEAGLPTVLVIEDLHWADEATLDVARLIARRVTAAPALVCVSYREEQVGRFHHLRVLLGELAGSRGTVRLEVPALSRQAVAAMAQGFDVDVAELFRLTQGNPFFVTETLASGADGVPPTVRDAVLARAARLSDSARGLLDSAAVVPQCAEQWLIDAVSGSPVGCIEECLTSGMLTFDTRGISFRHELAREAIEQSLAPDHRRLLHTRTLRALAAPPSGRPDSARLAYHAEQAGDSEAVLLHAPQAAVQASQCGAHAEAQAHYARALTFAGALDPEQRAELLEGVAEEGYLTDLREGCIDAATEALDIRRSQNDPRAEGRTQLLRAKLLSCAGRQRESYEAMQGAVSVLEDAGSGAELARAYAGMCISLVIQERPDDAVSWGLRALALAEHSGDPETLIVALTDLGTAELCSGGTEGRDRLDRSIALAREHGLAAEAGRAYINVVAGLAQCSEWPAVDPLPCGRHPLLPGARPGGVGELPNRCQGRIRAGAGALGRGRGYRGEPRTGPDLARRYALDLAVGTWPGPRSPG